MLRRRLAYLRFADLFSVFIRLLSWVLVPPSDPAGNVQNGIPQRRFATKRRCLRLRRFVVRNFLLRFDGNFLLFRLLFGCRFGDLHRPLRLSQPVQTRRNRRLGGGGRSGGGGPGGCRSFQRSFLGGTFLNGPGFRCGLRFMAFSGGHAWYGTVRTFLRSRDCCGATWADQAWTDQVWGFTRRFGGFGRGDCVRGAQPASYLKKILFQLIYVVHL